MDKARRFEIMGYRQGLRVISVDLTVIRADEMNVMADLKYIGTFPDDLKKSRRAISSLTAAIGLINNAIAKLDNIT